MFHFQTIGEFAFDSRFLFARSSMFIDGSGGMHEVDSKDFVTSKADSLSRNIAHPMLFIYYDANVVLKFISRVFNCAACCFSQHLSQQRLSME